MSRKPRVGDYAVIHVGFALNLLDEAEAQETLKMMSEVDLFAEVPDDPFAGVQESEETSA